MLTETGINKKSCAELTEAINSMYKWYKNAQQCYVYLYDVPEKHWTKSDWFTRGWTLQELIAPSRLGFYDFKWTKLGTKEGFKDDISRITGIRESILSGLTPLLVPVAEKMSWVSRRQTTRIEDTAYCLMGIFDVNMPLLYGEGSKAFQRLQIEIIRRSNTYTIFAWRIPNFPHRYHSALALSPTYFNHSEVQFVFKSLDRPALTTSLGIRVEVYLRRYRPHDDLYRDLYEAVFQRERESDGLSPSILVLHIPGEPQESEIDGEIPAGDNFVRVNPSYLDFVDLKYWPSDLRNRSKTEIVLNDVSIEPPLPSRPELTQTIYIVKAEPQGFLEENGEAMSFSARNYLAKPNSGKMIGLIYNIHPRWFIIAVGLAASGAPWCQILIPPVLNRVSQAQELYGAFDLKSDVSLPAVHKLKEIHASVWLNPSINHPILCVSVEIGSLLEIV
jgi:hypothetical protein